MTPDPRSPIHVEAIGLANVRFYQSPLDGPRQPWHSVDDLYAAMSLPRELRRVLKSKMQKHPKWKQSFRAISTTEGEVIIAPHFMAQGLISMAVEVSGLSKDFEHSYTVGIVHAMNVITAGMSELDGMNYSLAAFRNENGLPPMPPLDETSIIRMGPA